MVKLQQFTCNGILVMVRFHVIEIVTASRMRWDIKAYENRSLMV